MFFAREMVDAPIQLLENVECILQQLKKDYPHFLITKGDLIDQETKFARCGLYEYFDIIATINHTKIKIKPIYTLTPNKKPI